MAHEDELDRYKISTNYNSVKCISIWTDKTTIDLFFESERNMQEFVKQLYDLVGVPVTDEANASVESSLAAGQLHVQKIDPLSNFVTPVAKVANE
jgi:hypothetical protein